MPTGDIGPRRAAPERTALAPNVWLASGFVVAMGVGNGVAVVANNTSSNVRKRGNATDAATASRTICVTLTLSCVRTPSSSWPRTELRVRARRSSARIDAGRYSG